MHLSPVVMHELLPVPASGIAQGTNVGTGAQHIARNAWQHAPGGAEETMHIVGRATLSTDAGRQNGTVQPREIDVDSADRRADNNADRAERAGPPVVRRDRVHNDLPDR